MVKHLLTLACAAVALSASAATVVDYEINYGTCDKFPFYVMGYTPTFEDGVMKASNPGSWYQFFMADNIGINEAYTYTVTVKVKSSKAGSMAMNMGWGWGEGEQANGTLNVTTEWAEQTCDFHNVATGSANVVLQPGGFDGDLEFEWLKVSHEDVSLDPALQCMIINNIPSAKDNGNDLDIWDCSFNYAFPTPIAAGTYNLSFDVYGVTAGEGAAIWGTLKNGDDDAAWYGGGEFNIAADQWTTINKTFTIDNPMSVLNFVFGGKYKGKTLYFDNFVMTKADATENVIANSEFTEPALGHWSRPSWLKYDLYVGNGPAHGAAGIEAIEADTAAPVYYNLHGVRMAEGNLPAGIYVKVTGNKAEKVAIRY